MNFWRFFLKACTIFIEVFSKRLLKIYGKKLDAAHKKTCSFLDKALKNLKDIDMNKFVNISFDILLVMTLFFFEIILFYLFH